MYDIDSEYGQQFKGNLLAGILNQLTKEARQDALKNPIVESYVVGEIASNMHRKPYPVFDPLKVRIKNDAKGFARLHLIALHSMMNTSENQLRSILREMERRQ